LWARGQGPAQGPAPGPLSPETGPWPLAPGPYNTIGNSIDFVYIWKESIDFMLF